MLHNLVYVLFCYCSLRHSRSVCHLLSWRLLMLISPVSLLFLTRFFFSLFLLSFKASFFLSLSVVESIHVPNHGLSTPNEGINQRNLKSWADVAAKICFGRIEKFGSGSGFFGRAVKAISSPGVRSPCTKYSCILLVTMQFCFVSILLSNTAVSSFGASLEVGTNIWKQKCRN